MCQRRQIIEYMTRCWNKRWQQANQELSSADVDTEWSYCGARHKHETAHTRIVSMIYDIVWDVGDKA